MAWINTPASISLDREFDLAFPNRDTASDGTIGDGEHSQSVSDHNPDESGNTGGKEDADGLNEVHARDIGITLRRSGWTMERCVQLILARCRRGVEKRLDYIIFDSRIWARSSGWVQRAYAGRNPHDHHAHFSFRYGSGGGTSNPENITSGWGILAAIEADKPKEWDVVATEAQVQNAVENGVRAVFWDAHYAAQAGLNPTSAAAKVYSDATDARQKEMRNARDTLASVILFATKGDFDQVDAALGRLVQPTVPATSAASKTQQK